MDTHETSSYYPLVVSAVHSLGCLGLFPQMMAEGIGVADGGAQVVGVGTGAAVAGAPHDSADGRGAPLNGAVTRATEGNQQRAEVRLDRAAGAPRGGCRRRARPETGALPVTGEGAKEPSASASVCASMSYRIAARSKGRR